MVAAIESQDPDFVICDNRLQPRQMAQTYGVSVVKKLIKRHRPAMLLTTYGSPDRLMLASSSFEVPVIVQRDYFGAEHLGAYYELCSRNIASVPDRKSTRL